MIGRQDLHGPVPGAAATIQPAMGPGQGLPAAGQHPGRQLSHGADQARPEDGDLANQPGPAGSGRIGRRLGPGGKALENIGDMILVPGKADGRHHPGKHPVFTGPENKLAAAITTNAPVPDHQEPGRIGADAMDPVPTLSGQAAEGARLHRASEFRQTATGGQRRPAGRSGGLDITTTPGRCPGPVRRAGQASPMLAEKRFHRLAGRIPVQANGQVKAQQAAHLPGQQDNGRRIGPPAGRMLGT